MAHALTHSEAGFSWRGVMLAAGVLATVAILIDFVAPAITALAVLFGVSTVLAWRTRWGVYPLAALNATVVVAFGIQLMSKGVLPSAYGFADFVGVVIGTPIAAVGLTACVGCLLDRRRH